MKKALILIYLIPLACFSKENLNFDDDLFDHKIFFKIRETILAHKWQPIINLDAIPFNNKEANEQKLIKAGIKELGSCAMDIPLCTFFYKKNNECLVLTTEGEDINNLVFANLNIGSYSAITNECELNEPYDYDLSYLAYIRFLADLPKGNPNILGITTYGNYYKFIKKQKKNK